MQKVKKNVRKPNKILEQLAIRFSSPIPSVQTRTIGAQRDRLGIITKYKFEDFTLTTKEGDNVCCLNSGTPIKIVGFEMRDDICYLKGLQFQNKRDFFNLPMPSSTIGILLVDSSVADAIKSYPIDEVSFKYFCLPHEINEVVLMPLIHSLSD